MSLATYERLKLDLAATLRELSAAGELAASRDALLARLAQDRFNLVTVGRFNRGKSSLMNALLGTGLLPMGIVPLTTVITMVGYGSAPRATLRYRGTSLFMDIDLAELPLHVTEAGNPGNREGISHVEVDLPATLLRHGFRFIDTPGLGSSIASNERTTRAFLGDADALLLVTGFDAPLTGEEMDLLRTARRLGTPLFLAVNKADLVDDNARNDVLDFIAEQLGAAGLDDVPVFGVSALQGLAGPEPGIEALRAALIRFMAGERARTFLGSMARRTRELLTAAGRLDDMPAIDALTANAAALDGDEDATGSQGEVIPRAPCPICSAGARTCFDFITNLQYRLRHDAERRAAFARGESLCPGHAHQFGSIAGPLSVASGLADTIEAIADQVDAIAHSSRSCPVCAAVRHAEAAEIAAQAEREPESDALVCLQHLPALLRAVPPPRQPATRARLAAAMRDLAMDMRRFALRRDGAARAAISANEAAAPLEAIRLLGGDSDA